MDSDPYQTLGVDSGAGADELRRAYRRRAKLLHPDLNPGDKQAEAAFKQLSAAYGLLSDPLRRARYDRGEIDADGDESNAWAEADTWAEPNAWAEANEVRDPDAFDAAGGVALDHDDVLSEIFTRGEHGAFSSRGQDAFHRFEVPFLELINGTTRVFTVPNGTSLEVKIPAGIREGQILRLRGKGHSGAGDGPPGDALVEIASLAHPIFSRKGDDVHLEFPVTVPEAVLGADVEVPTPTGSATITLPRGVNTDTVLRLRGQGVPRSDGTRGDEYLTLKVMLPDEPDGELEAFVARWPGGAYDPRSDLRQDIAENATRRTAEDT